MITAAEKRQVLMDEYKQRQAKDEFYRRQSKKAIRKTLLNRMEETNNELDERDEF